jgi:transcriptional regulator with XRE-family HTH domain
MGDEIKRIREKFNLTQIELAKMLGVSQPRIARMEKQKTVTIEMLRKIAKKLRVSIKDLVNNNQIQ